MFQRFQLAVAWILVWSCVGLAPAQPIRAEDAKEAIRAGAHAQEITPPRFPISVNGNMADHLATGAHDPLYARCIAIRNATTSMAFVICDCCMIPRDVMDKAKTRASTKSGIPISHILISATHAHSCPTVASVFQSDPDAEYVDFLIEQIALGIERAHSQAEPARIGWGSVEEPSLLFNRRWYIQPDANQVDPVENPFGKKSDRVITNPGFNNPRVKSSVNLIDPELSFLSIQARDGRPIALLANYSLHYIGGVPGDLVSADYFGEFSQRVTRQLKATDVNPPFVAALSNGTSGDVNNVDFRQKSAPPRAPFEQIAYAAEVLAQDIAKVYEKIEYHEAPPLKIREAEIVVGVRKPSGEEVAAAEQKLAAVSQRPLQGLPLIYARETTLLAQYPDSVRIKLQAIRIGSLGIATSPCETFTETGLAIKKTSPLKHTFTISLANGYNGYLPPPEQHILGGYETWRARSSYVASDAEPTIQATIKRLLNDVSR